VRQSGLGVDPLAQQSLSHAGRPVATVRKDVGGAPKTLLGFFEAPRIHEHISEVFQGETFVNA